MDSVGLLGTIVLSVGSVIVALIARRSAKDQTAVRGFADLNKALQEQVDRQDARIRALELSEAEWRRAAREHEAWDHDVLERLRDLTGGVGIPEQPPLDRW